MDLIVQKSKETSKKLTNHGIGFYTSGKSIFLDRKLIYPDDIRTTVLGGVLHACSRWQSWFTVGSCSFSDIYISDNLYDFTKLSKTKALFTWMVRRAWYFFAT